MLCYGAFFLFSTVLKVDLNRFPLAPVLYTGRVSFLTTFTVDILFFFFHWGPPPFELSPPIPF